MNQLHVETEQESDGRWLAEVMELPGVMCYGATEREAVKNANVLALRFIADRIEAGEDLPDNLAKEFALAA